MVGFWVVSGTEGSEFLDGTEDGSGGVEDSICSFFEVFVVLIQAEFA